MSDTTYFNIEATGSTGDNSCGPCLKVIRREYESRIAALRSLVESLEEVKADQKARITTLEAQVEQAREALERIAAESVSVPVNLNISEEEFRRFQRETVRMQALVALQALREGGENA